MKKISTFALAALMAVSPLALSPAFAGKSKKSTVKQTQAFKGSLKGHKKGIEYQPTIIAGSKNWIKRLHVGRGPGFNGGFVGHPGGT